MGQNPIIYNDLNIISLPCRPRPKKYISIQGAGGRGGGGTEKNTIVN